MKNSKKEESFNSKDFTIHNEMIIKLLNDIKNTKEKFSNFCNQVKSALKEEKVKKNIDIIDQKISNEQKV